MATHSDGSDSDDTWLFGDGQTIYNHPHKCHPRKARKKEVKKQQVERRIEEEKEEARMQRERNETTETD